MIHKQYNYKWLMLVIWKKKIIITQIIIYQIIINKLMIMQILNGFYKEFSKEPLKQIYKNKNRRKKIFNIMNAQYFN